jgi:hypothetical protein
MIRADRSAVNAQMLHSPWQDLRGGPNVIICSGTFSSFYFRLSLAERKNENRKNGK